MTSSERWGLARRWLPHGAAAIVLTVLFVWDREVYDAIGSVRSPFLTWLTEGVSQLRGVIFPFAVGVLLLAAGLIGRRSRLRRAGTAVLLTVMLAGAITLVMKEVVARPGPEVDDAPRPGESWLELRFGRFPSSHSAVTFGAASALAAFVPVTAVPGFAVAVLVCHERIYRATHFPSDIFAGSWIGLAAARFVIAQLARIGWKDDLVPVRPERWPPETSASDWVDETPREDDRQPVA